VSAPTVLSLLGKFHPNHPSSPCADILTACEILGLGLELGTGGWICRGPASGKQNRPQGYIKHKEVGRKGGKMGWGDAKSSVLNRFSWFLLFFFSYQPFYVRVFVLALYTEKLQVLEEKIKLNILFWILKARMEIPLKIFKTFVIL